jgi:exopolysaccharide biosynthesis polyprenyl glycosylphosphotransferase
MRPIDLLGHDVIKDRPRVSGHDAGNTRRRTVSPGLLRDLVIVFDAVVVLACSFLAKILYIDVFLGTGIAPDYAGVGCLAALICFWRLKEQRLQEDDFHSLPYRKVLRALIASFGILMMLGAALKLTGTFSRGWMSTWFSLTFVMILVKDRLCDRLLRSLAARGYIGRVVAIYGAGPKGSALKAELERKSPGVLIADLYDSFGLQDTAGLQQGDAAGGIRGDMRKLIQDGLNNRFERIIVCLPQERMEELSPLIENISFLPVNIQVCPDQLDWAGTSPRMTYSQGRYFIDISDPPLKTWGGIGKRALDLAGAGLIASVALPFAVLAAIAIKLESAGPVLTKQRRHGYNHQTIEVFAFRTTSATSMDDSERFEATQGEQALTRMGRFLKRTRLEKVPRLLNVLAGEMSLVGPRPHVLAHNHYCNEVVARYASRHKVKPGMTGWAQVHGFRESTEQMETMADQAAVDIHYIENWSMGLDLKVLALTPLLLLFRRPDSAPVRALSRVLAIGRADFGPARAAVREGMASVGSPDPQAIEWMSVFDKMTIVPDTSAKAAFLDRMLRPKACTVVEFINAHAINLCAENVEFLRAVQKCDILLRDGIGMKLAFGMLGKRPGLNMNGTDLIPAILDGLDGRKVALMGSSEPWLSRAAEHALTRGCKLEIVLDGFQPAEVYVEALRRQPVELVVLGMGMPRQEEIAEKLKATYPDSPMLVLCGGAVLDFMAGRHPRAPLWMRRIGAEWVYRLCREPIRLFGRYIVGNPQFLARVLRNTMRQHRSDIGGRESKERPVA